jgi:acyl-CoA reductase-like NAD-dependent aldehyde dehydrogenase
VPRTIVRLAKKPRLFHASSPPPFEESRNRWSKNSPTRRRQAVAGHVRAFRRGLYNPTTGQVRAWVPLAGADEVRAVVDDAERAQAAWGEWNPQRCARVLLRFLQLVDAEREELARLLSSEHGKTIADAHGDIQRGLEVVEFAAGIPHLTKGEFTDNAGTGIDVYSMRQPLGVGFVGSTPIAEYVYSTATAHGKRAQCFGGPRTT